MKSQPVYTLHCITEKNHLANLPPLVHLQHVVASQQRLDRGDAGRDVDTLGPLDGAVQQQVGSAHVEGDPVNYLLLEALVERAGELGVEGVIALDHHQVVEVSHGLLLPLLAPGVHQPIFGVVVVDEPPAHGVEHGGLQSAQYLGARVGSRE